MLDVASLTTSFDNCHGGLKIFHALLKCMFRYDIGKSNPGVHDTTLSLVLIASRNLGVHGFYHPERN